MRFATALLAFPLLAFLACHPELSDTGGSGEPPDQTPIFDIEWVMVDEAGNAADTNGTNAGAVAVEYRISTYEITNSQYSDFLNAIAASDPNGLFNGFLDSGLARPRGGITRTDPDGSYTYAPIGGREDMPVNWVTFYDAIRFANWLHNYQPTGAQDASTTEDGAYAITPQGITDNSIARKPGAEFFLPSYDEWYKAAYHRRTLDSYFAYATRSNAVVTCAAPTATANSANCGFANAGLAAVGSYTESFTLYRTFDQGGNVSEWTEAGINTPERGMEGGNFIQGPAFTNSMPPARTAAPTSELPRQGFRVAALAEPPPEPPPDPPPIVF